VNVDQLFIVWTFVAVVMSIAMIWIAHLFDKASDRMYVAMIQAQRDRDELFRAFQSIAQAAKPETQDGSGGAQG